MPRELLLPELAESVVEGEIVRWLVEEGDTVAEDQPIVEVMTDKVTVELPSPYAGVLQKHLAAPGDVVEVHKPIALFADDGAGTSPAESESGEIAEEKQRTAGTDGSTGKSVAPAEAEDDGDKLSLFRPSKESEEGPALQVRRQGGSRGSVQAAAQKPTGPYGRVLAVPAARKLARELGVDIEAVEGSGPNGRVRVDDVRAHSETPTTTRPAPATYPADQKSLEERIPVRGLRRAISQQMVASHLQSVRTLHVDEADVSALVSLRNRLKPMAEKRGAKLSYLPFIMKAVVAALREFPMINAALDEDAGEIVRKHYYNLGVAVATESGLVVPVIHDVDRKSVLEIAADVHEKAQRARDGKLTTEDVKGGTFSITNIGSLGGLFSFPIINVPEAAILGVHSIKKRPVVLEDDSIVAREMLYLSLSFDHRLVDGAEAAMFTSHLIEILETPESLLLEL